VPALPRPGSLIVSGQLNGVAALSAASVWAVGSTLVGNAVSMHWDDSRWTEVLTPYGDRPVSPAGDFAAVAAVSARDIWAVGGIGGSPVGHWDGRAWSPSPAPPADLQSVAADSAADVWAVGSSRDTGRPVILHWNGSAWAAVASPVPAGLSAELHGVAVVSAASAWAVGQADSTASTGSATSAPLIEHWNGAGWTLVPSPAIPGGGTLAAVSASSQRNAWAVGASGRTGLIEHWDGRAWTIVPSPGLGDGGSLQGVTIVSADDVWAVGGAVCLRQGLRTVIEHWDGRAWTLVPSPATGMLTAVAAASPTSAWAVGSWSGGPTAIIEHWDGTAWTWPPGFCAAPSGPGCYPPGTSSSSPLPANTYVVP
jgi:hypothetical protein